MADLTGISILLVEDRDDERELYATAMEVLGAQVTASATIKDTIRILAISKPDIIVTDIAFPGESGYDLLRHVRNDESSALKTVPIVAITGMIRVGVREDTNVFDAVLDKPLDMEQLGEMIADLVKGNKPES
ncbi:MAG TPA: response regulator [Acidobacteriota bacterium]|jgi:CheY-like chemotaxis protein